MIYLYAIHAKYTIQQTVSKVIFVQPSPVLEHFHHSPKNPVPIAINSTFFPYSPGALSNH